MLLCWVAWCQMLPLSLQVHHFKNTLQSQTQGARIEMVSITPAMFTFNICVDPGFCPNGAFAYMQNTHVYQLLSYQPDFRPFSSRCRDRFLLTWHRHGSPWPFWLRWNDPFAANPSSKNIYLKFFVLILSKLPIQAAYRILVQQDSDALMVACPWALFSSRCLHINKTGWICEIKLTKT